MLNSALQQESERPTIVPGFGVWVLFKNFSNGKPLYIVGNRSSDRYVTVPAGKLPAVLACVSLMDGTRSVEQVEGALYEQNRIALDVAALSNHLRAAGLVEGRSAAKACLGEIDRASLTAVRMPIDALLRLLGKSRLLASLWAAVICSLLLTLMIAAIADPVSRSLDLHMLVLDRKVMPLSAWLIGGGLASVFLHELSHCLIAATFGLREGQFRVQLIYGLFPSLTLKLKGLYTLSESRRMMVWSAGVVTNVGIVSTLLLIERRFGDSPLLHWTLSVNWWLAIINLIPFLPTDGYFFAATLLKEPNIRVRSWSWLLHPWSKPSQALSVFVIGYGVGTVALILFTIWARCRAILHAHYNHPLEWMVPAAVLLASLFVVGRLVRNNLANTESV